MWQINCQPGQQAMLCLWIHAVTECGDEWHFVNHRCGQDSTVLPSLTEADLGSHLRTVFKLEKHKEVVCHALECSDHPLDLGPHAAHWQLAHMYGIPLLRSASNDWMLLVSQGRCVFIFRKAVPAAPAQQRKQRAQRRCKRPTQTQGTVVV